MDSKNRNLWILLIVVLIILCCCAVAAGAAVTSWLTARATDIGPFDLGSLNSERIERRFDVGDAPRLDMTNFAGAIIVRAGESGEIRVSATKKASSWSRLERIMVEMAKQENRLVITTKKRVDFKGGSVDFEIDVPAGTWLDLRTGAGTVDVRDVAGRIDVYSGAGTIHVRGAQGTVRLGLGAGQIAYEGAPGGECRFETGAGEIVLRLPEEPDVEVDLGTGLGAVDVDFAVDGRVRPREVNGVIGDGSQGSIFARTGLGTVSIKHR